MREKLKDVPAAPGVYQIRNTVNGKVYVGSSQNMRARLRAHHYCLEHGTHINRHLQNAWSKDGAEAFVFEVLEVLETSDRKMLLAAEDHWLRQLRSSERRYGYNLNRQAQVGPEMVSQETRALLSARRRGKKASAESREKMSRARLGMEFSAEHRENIRKARLGKRSSEASRQKQSKKLKGKPPTTHTIERARCANSRDYRIVYPDGKWEVIRNLTGFCKTYELPIAKMLAMARGEFGQYRGWGCQRLSEDSPLKPGDTGHGPIPSKKSRVPRSHCKQGHPLSGDNLYVTPQGTRTCRTCRNKAARRYQEKKS